MYNLPVCLLSCLSLSSAGLAVKNNIAGVTVDGVKRSFEFNTQNLVIRVSGLNKTVANAAGTRICLVTKGLTNLISQVGVNLLCDVCCTPA